jgi:TIR domain-containing protein
MARIFLSYRREDTRWAALFLAEGVRLRLGANQVFHDVDGIRAGTQWRVRIGSALDTCRVLVAMIGGAWGAVPDSAGRRRLHEPDDLVAFEIAHALRAGTSIVPVLVDGAEMPDCTTLPEPLRRLPDYQAVPLAYRSWRENVDRIVDAVEAQLPPPPPTSRPMTWDDAKATGSARIMQLFQQADEHQPDPERPAPPPPSPPSTEVADLSEVGVMIWRSSGTSLLLEVGAALDRDPAPDLAEAAEMYAGRLRVARCSAADPTSGLDEVAELEITVFPTLVLFRNRVEVRRAGPDARTALLRNLPVLLD